MFNIPDHPDIQSAMRTGYPRSYHNSGRCVDEDWEYENRRDEALIAGHGGLTDEEREARLADARARVGRLFNGGGSR